MIISEAIFLVGAAMAVALVCWLTLSRTRIWGPNLRGPVVDFRRSSDSSMTDRLSWHGITPKAGPSRAANKVAQ